MDPVTRDAARQLMACAPLLDEVFAASADRFYVYDLAGRCLYVSRADAAEFDIDRAGALGKTWRDLGLPGQVVETLEALHRQVVMGGQPVTGETTLDTPLGARCYRYTYVPVRDAGGALMAIAGAVRDVTAEREADRQRRESEDLYRALSEAAFEGIALHEEGRILQANETCARIFGYPREELIGMSILDLAAPESRDQVRAMALSGSDRAYTAMGLRQDGTTFPGELQGKDVWFQGRTVRVTAVRDLTEQRRMEQERRTAEERWQMVVESSPDIISLFDPDGRFAYVNRTPWGLRPEDVLGKHVLDFVPEHERERVQEAFRRVFEEGLAQSYETEAIGPQGQPAFYQTRVVPLRSGSMVTCALAIATDLTPVRHATLQLARQAVALEQAHELNRIKANFVNAVSHELRTPLTSIFGYLEFLEDRIGGELTPEQGQYVDQIAASARRLARLVDDLLDFARLEAGTFALHEQQVALQEVLQAALKSFIPHARERRVRLESAPLPESLAACVDPQRLQQVLGNLLSNALKFTPEGGRVWIEARAEGPMARVSVHDTGVGIPEKELPRLFQRFSQLEAGLRSGTGSGLGLSIAKALVEAHGGTIGVSSTPGSGSEFWFTVPLVASRAEGPATPEPPEAP